MELARLLAGSLMLRPYVFTFLVAYLFAAVARMGWVRTGLFTAIAWAVAYAAELSSTRNGFPFGLYTYIDATRTQELWLSNVPFFDSLSFTFLCYVGHALAVLLYAPLVIRPGDLQVADTRTIRTSTRVLLTGAFLTTLLDVVIDPVALQGERWFLGRIYFYPNGGVHFGVPLSNYAGWFLVALVSIGLFQRCERHGWPPAGIRHVPYGGLVEPLIYLGVLAFNLSITVWIGERLMGVVGLTVAAPVVVLFLTHVLNPMRRATAADVVRHLADYPVSPLRPRAAVEDSVTAPDRIAAG